MKTATTAALFILCAMSAHSDELSKDIDERIAHCKDKWSTDFQMQKYCLDKISEGYNSALEHMAWAEEYDHPLLKSFAACKEKWKPQWDMINYCFDKNIEGWDDYARIFKSLPDETANQVYYHCVPKWHPQYDMIGYCFRKQEEAWKKLQ